MKTKTKTKASSTLSDLERFAQSLERAPAVLAALLDPSASFLDLAPARRWLQDVDMTRASHDVVLLRRFLLARARLASQHLRATLEKQTQQSLPAQSRDDKAALAAWRARDAASVRVRAFFARVSVALEEEKDDDDRAVASAGAGAAGAGAVAPDLVFRRPPQLPVAARRATDYAPALVTARVYLQALLGGRDSHTPATPSSYASTLLVATPVQAPHAGDFSESGVSRVRAWLRDTWTPWGALQLALLRRTPFADLAVEFPDRFFAAIDAQPPGSWQPPDLEGRYELEQRFIMHLLRGDAFTRDLKSEHLSKLCRDFYSIHIHQAPAIALPLLHHVARHALRARGDNVSAPRYEELPNGTVHADATNRYIADDVVLDIARDILQADSTSAAYDLLLRGKERVLTMRMSEPRTFGGWTRALCGGHFHSMILNSALAIRKLDKYHPFAELGGVRGVMDRLLSTLPVQTDQCVMMVYCAVAEIAHDPDSSITFALNRESTSSSSSCSVCGVTCSEIAGLYALRGCEHTACLGCWVEWGAVCKDRPDGCVRCVQSGCDGEVFDRAFVLLDWRMLKRAHLHTYGWCGASDSPSWQQQTCRSRCCFKSCRCRCGLLLHAPYSCQQAASACAGMFSVFTKQLERAGAVRDCPSCGVATHRSDGCLHMHCSSCGFHWCWSCGGPHHTSSYEEPCSELLARDANAALVQDQHQDAIKIQEIAYDQRSARLRSVYMRRIVESESTFPGCADWSSDAWEREESWMNAWLLDDAAGADLAPQMRWFVQQMTDGVCYMKLDTTIVYSNQDDETAARPFVRGASGVLQPEPGVFPRVLAWDHSGRDYYSAREAVMNPPYVAHASRGPWLIIEDYNAGASALALVEAVHRLEHDCRVCPYLSYTSQRFTHFTSLLCASWSRIQQLPRDDVSAHAAAAAASSAAVHVSDLQAPAFYRYADLIWLVEIDPEPPFFGNAWVLLSLPTASLESRFSVPAALVTAHFELLESAESLRRVQDDNYIFQRDVDPEKVFRNAVFERAYELTASRPFGQPLALSMYAILCIFWGNCCSSPYSRGAALDVHWSESFYFHAVVAALSSLVHFDWLTDEFTGASEREIGARLQQLQPFSRSEDHAFIVLNELTTALQHWHFYCEYRRASHGHDPGHYFTVMPPTWRS